MEYTPNDFFEARKRTIDATYGRLEKSEKIDIEKGGQGSGRKIGTTSSGKTIYDSHDHPEHKDFNREDHRDAATIHDEKEDKAGRNAGGNYEERDKHRANADAHWKKHDSLKKSEEVIEDLNDEPTADEMAKADAEFDLMKSTELLDKPFDFTI